MQLNYTNVYIILRKSNLYKLTFLDLYDYNIYLKKMYFKYVDPL